MMYNFKHFVLYIWTHFSKILAPSTKIQAIFKHVETWPPIHNPSVGAKPHLNNSNIKITSG